MIFLPMYGNTTYNTIAADPSIVVESLFGTIGNGDASCLSLQAVKETTERYEQLWYQ